MYWSRVHVVAMVYLRGVGPGACAPCRCCGGAGTVVYWCGVLVVVYVRGVGAVVDWYRVCERCRCCGVNKKRFLTKDPSRRFWENERQCFHPPKTARGSCIPKRILRTLQAPGVPRAQNSEMVVDSKQTNSQDAPRASAPIHRKQRERGRFQTEF